MAEAKRRLAAILAADVAGYSRLMGDDERATMETLNACRDVFRNHITNRDGRVVDTAGDSVLAVFDSVVEAVQCAVDVQDELENLNDDLPESRRMLFRIGVNLGDVFEQEDGTIYGDGVNVAARLEALAEPGAVIISESAHMQVRTKLEISFADLGVHEVKNIAERVRAYRVAASGTTAPIRRKWPNHWSPVYLLPFAAILIVTSIVSWPDLETAPPAETTTDTLLALPTGPSIAVLPFKNRSDDPDQVFFVDGMTEELITELIRFRDLLVFSSNTMFTYKDRAVDVREVGRDLGADYVLEGSVRRAGNTLRVTAQLTDAESGASLWGRTYDRDLSPVNIFEVQDEISDAVVTAIAQTHGVIHLSELEASARRPPEELAAYDCVLRTLEYYRSVNQEEHAVVRDCLEHTVELEPDYAKAWAFLARVYADEHMFGWNDPLPEPLVRAREAIERASSIDPEDGTAFMVSAITNYFERNLERFHRDVDRALQLSPNDSYILGWLGEFMSLAGRFERGAAMIEKAARMNPQHPGFYNWPLFRVDYMDGNYEEAMEHLNQLGQPGLYWQHGAIALCLIELDRTREAREALDEALRLNPEFINNYYQDVTNFHWTEDGHNPEFVERLVESIEKFGYEVQRDSS